ncbi:RNA polymerase subunit sigma-70 [Aerophototrophica crusticola]|uniref:RNA polymerase subunit sigma-70 n=2 Tax=Aerophototrophica crusticola TaxID=1709002 RepID=A0A858RB50_9PROT|nr:RNA polymerase subunit sigma-70 [Rhodospirillaceae bacterium B3]
MPTLKQFEAALREQGQDAALAILAKLRERDRETRSIRPARKLTGKKMTPELAREVLHLHQTTDLTQQEIAFRLGVNQGRVNEVVKHGKWLSGDPTAPEAVSRDKAKKRAEAGVGIAPRKPKAKAKPKEAKPKPAEPTPAPKAGQLSFGL